jgi:hypothetical protein
MARNFISIQSVDLRVLIKIGSLHTGGPRSRPTVISSGLDRIRSLVRDQPGSLTLAWFLTGNLEA